MSCPGFVFNLLLASVAFQLAAATERTGFLFAFGSLTSNRTLDVLYGLCWAKAEIALIEANTKITENIFMDSRFV